MISALADYDWLVLLLQVFYFLFCMVVCTCTIDILSLPRSGLACPPAWAPYSFLLLLFPASLDLSVHRNGHLISLSSNNFLLYLLYIQYSLSYPLLGFGVGLCCVGLGRDAMGRVLLCWVGSYANLNPPLEPAGGTPPPNPNWFPPSVTWGKISLSSSSSPPK